MTHGVKIKVEPCPHPGYKCPRMTHNVTSHPSPLPSPGALETNSGRPVTSPKGDVSVFQFTDYRQYLLAFYEAKKANNGAYSMSSFVRRAGLGANSRGYLKLVIEGKRSLTPHTLRRFIDAMGLKGREAIYFENLVYFNQSKTSKDRDYYFQRLASSTGGKGESRPIELLKSQHDYFSNWYYIAIRELVALGDFQEDPAWICSRLKGKISRKNAADALTALQRIGLIRRNENGKLVQSEPVVNYKGGDFSAAIDKLHLEMIERASEALKEDPKEDADTSFATLSVDRAKYAEIKQMIEAFRERLITKFGTAPETPDSVLQINFQLFHLTSDGAKASKKQEKQEK
jgi:uncharacterized protein (TIGR02147 family)